MQSPLVIAYIGLGSNLQQPQMQVESAMHELDDVPSSRVLRCSGLYRSIPMGPVDQPDFINAVVALETGLTAALLLRELQNLEQRHQRVRSEHWGPRTLDLDLLLYGDDTIQSEHLVVPHPGVPERNFVLLPLFEIAPDLRLPDNRTLAELIQSCTSNGIQRLVSVD